MQNMMLRMRKVKLELAFFVKRFSLAISTAWMPQNRHVFLFAVHSGAAATAGRNGPAVGPWVDAANSGAPRAVA
jgi:hypothetical protein